MTVRSALAESLCTALASEPRDHLLVGDFTELSAKAKIPAAVLIAITDQPDPGVILTVRREHLRTHAGQVAFPGGRLDCGESVVEAALREAHEEILIDPRLVDVLQTMEPYRTVTGYVVTPVIGTIPAGMPLKPHEQEVSDWFEAPLRFLLDPANQRKVNGLFHGETRHYYEIIWANRRIWGATAAMIVNLSRRLQWH